MKRKKPSPISLTVIALQLWVLLTTYLNHGDLQRAFVNMVSVVSLMLIVDSFPKRTILYPIFYNFEWMIYVNLATIILFPQGLYQQGVHNEFLDFSLGLKTRFSPTVSSQFWWRDCCIFRTGDLRKGLRRSWSLVF